jgi:hypothetical protein
MVLSIPVNSALEARLRREAAAEGKDIEGFVAELVERAVGEIQAEDDAVEELSGEEFDRELESFFQQHPEPLPSLPLDFGEADIYADHD